MRRQCAVKFARRLSISITRGTKEERKRGGGGGGGGGG